LTKRRTREDFLRELIAEINKRVGYDLLEAIVIRSHYRDADWGIIVDDIAVKSAIHAVIEHMRDAHELRSAPSWRGSENPAVVGRYLVNLAAQPLMPCFPTADEWRKNDKGILEGLNCALRTYLDSMVGIMERRANEVMEKLQGLIGNEVRRQLSNERAMRAIRTLVIPDAFRRVAEALDKVPAHQQESFLLMLTYIMGESDGTLDRKELDALIDATIGAQSGQNQPN
jgi:hypothetical protein